MFFNYLIISLLRRNNAKSWVIPDKSLRKWILPNIKALIADFGEVILLLSFIEINHCLIRQQLFERPLTVP